MAEGFDLIVVGTGFASTFYLREALAHLPPSARVLVLERGQRRTHAWQLANPSARESERKPTFTNLTPEKPWIFTLGFGGGSNCWWACTPRFLPADFAMKTRYGVGHDWPLSYDDLEPFYCEAEAAMSVAGSDAHSPVPRSKPFPLPPHRLSEPDLRLLKAFPDQFTVQPTARPTQAVGDRPACCNNGVCALCPIDSKFTVQNTMAQVYEDPRVEVRFGARVQRVDIADDVARGVDYVAKGVEMSSLGGFVAVGANAIFNPHILQRSGVSHPVLGKRLGEQVSVNVDILLDGLDNFQGSTSITGHGYMLYDGEHRRERGAALIETLNRRLLRPERGKWRQRMLLKIIVEDLPHEDSEVRPNADRPDVPDVRFGGWTPYAQKTLTELPRLLGKVLAPLPVERASILNRRNPSESHVIGTVMMGEDPETSVVDRHLRHHRVRNLAVLGASAYPTASPSNPTLTLSALSIWAARHTFSAA